MTHLSRPRAFSLVEVALSIAIIGVALLGIMGLLIPAMQSSREAATATIEGIVLEDVHNRTEGSPLVAGSVPGSPFFYDDQGQFIDSSQPADVQKTKLYRADVQLIDIAASPASTSGLKSIRLEIYYPIEPVSGAALPANAAPKTSITYYASPLTGPDWELIDANFVPRIEF